MAYPGVISGKDVKFVTVAVVNKGNLMHQMKLALAWNRNDVAKDEIFSDNAHWEVGLFCLFAYMHFNYKSAVFSTCV